MEYKPKPEPASQELLDAIAASEKVRRWGQWIELLRTIKAAQKGCGR